MKRRTAVFALGCAAVSGWLAPGLTSAWAAEDPLSLESNQKFLEDNKHAKGMIVRPSGLMFRIIQNGYGKRPGPTDTVRVYYTGRLINGVIFDGTSPGLPASLKLNSVIQGWVEALLIMREGDHWQLIIPANLGYGARAMGDGLIPPNQTLIFDLRLLATTPAPRRGDKDYRPDPGDEEQQ